MRRCPHWLNDSLAIHPYQDERPFAFRARHIDKGSVTGKQPGMTPTSLVPEQAGHAGISFQDLVVWMVDNAECDA